NTEPYTNLMNIDRADSSAGKPEADSLLATGANRNDGDAPNGPPTRSGAPTLSRRSFVKQVLAAGATANAVVLSSGVAVSEAKAAPGALPLPALAAQRRQDAYGIRQQAALHQFSQPVAAHPDNGDEDLYPTKIGSFSKGLPHNQLGEVDLNAYNALLTALSS